MEPTTNHGTGTMPVPQEANSSDTQAEPPATPLSVEQVFIDYAPRVYSVARKMVSNESDAEDVTQDVLLQVLRKLPSFRGEAAFPTWLHRITVNAALSHRRKRAVREVNRVRDSYDVILEEESEASQGRISSPPPETHLEDGETRRLIDQAVARLPEMYRQVFVLSDIDGVPNADIADRIGMSLPAVKSRLHRARALLREALAPHFDETLA
jgi:RNA polymerase sigma-70 factor (ECF subfamily)